MNRYEIFHHITTGSDLSSMRSILNVTLDQLLRVTNSEKGAWYAAGPGGLRTLAALDASGAKLNQPESHFPAQLVHKAAADNRAQAVDMPAMRNAINATGRGSIRRYLAAPAVSESQVAGVVCLDRRFQLPAFSHQEIEVLCHVLEDVMQLLNSSRDYERQRFELDRMKSTMVMNKVQLISKHPSMLNLFRLIEKLAKVPATVLIHGESGTGKELVARAIYELGQFSGPFIAINCGGIEPNLLKSELFGYMKGAFTGAARDRPGLFKKAEGGVLFLDEIGEMPSDMQVALLRTLQNGEILPVGADMPIQVDTRVVAATHRKLKDMVAENHFRNDLYQRLKGLTLEVPPLRKRRGDIPHLCEYFIRKYNDKFGLVFKGLQPEAAEMLGSLTFDQGNVRELEHMIERAMIFEDNEELIGVTHLQAEDETGESAPGGEIEGIGSFEEKLNHYGARLLEEAIRNSGGNKTQAMKSLGLSRSTFYGMLNRYGVSL